jgi:hypothetical protein
MGAAFSANFGDVRVHTNDKASRLNESLNSRAFTTGKDVFFRQGEYRPGSSAGRELLAHELTHVVQQGGGSVQRKDEEEAVQARCHCGGSGKAARAVQSKLSVGRLGDIYEQEADKNARAYMNWEMKSPMPDSSAAVRRQPEEEKEEEGALQAKRFGEVLSRQFKPEPEPEPEVGEMTQTKLQGESVQSQPEVEEEPELQTRRADGVGHGSSTSVA